MAASNIGVEALSPAPPSWLTRTHISIGIAVLLVAAAALYRAALPRVIPGVPYHSASAHKLLGDLPRLIRYLNGPVSEVTTWFANNCAELHAPVAQVFLAPFTQPMVVVADYREGEDILLRRYGEFDRAWTTTDLFAMVVPNGTVAMNTHDVWRTQRRMWAPTMGTEFLRDVAAPHIHAGALGFLQLWRKKALLAQGHPFAVIEDLRYVIMDVVWKLAVGEDLGAIRAQLVGLQRLQTLKRLPESKNRPAVIPWTAAPAGCKAIEVLMHSMEGFVSAPFPSLYSWWTHQKPSFKKAAKERDDMLNKALAAKRAAFRQKLEDSSSPITSAMDMTLKRELANSQRQGKHVEVTDANLKDELFVFMLGSYETTSSTLGWLVAYLAAAQDKQAALRASIMEAFPNASADRLPSAHDLAYMELPYVEAVISETLRVARTAGAVVRMSTCDTQVLGHVIPKKTPILIAFNAEQYLYDEAIPVEESRRSASSQANAAKYRPWAKEGKHDFVPERWLKDEGGRQVYDDKAGPMLTFSAGPRGCFGVKLARMKMKVLIALLVLTFELEPLPLSLEQPIARERIGRRPENSHVRLRVL